MAIDRDVLEAQRAVLRDAQELHRFTLQEAEHLELAALTAEQRAHDEGRKAAQLHADAAVAESSAHRRVLEAQATQAEQRTAIRELAADINEIVEVLRTLPQQRRPSADGG